MTHYSKSSTLFYLATCYSRFLATGKTLPFPRRVQIQTTTLCNGYCLFCPYRQLNSASAQGVMEESLFNKIIAELNTARYFSEIVFELHNEPLMDQRIFRFIQNVKTRTNNMACTLVTNGQLVDNYSVSEIRNSRVDRIIISLNAHYPETYERISGLNYKRIANNIETLLTEADLRQ